MNCHKLKIHPPYFNEVRKGRKTFEIRENDRDFQPNDLVVLQEYEPPVEGLYREGVFTGREMVFQIGYVTAFMQRPDFVVFSLLPWEEK